MSLDMGHIFYKFAYNWCSNNVIQAILVPRVLNWNNWNLMTLVSSLCWVDYPITVAIDRAGTTGMLSSWGRGGGLI